MSPPQRDDDPSGYFGMQKMEAVPSIPKYHGPSTHHFPFDVLMLGTDRSNPSLLILEVSLDCPLDSRLFSNRRAFVLEKKEAAAPHSKRRLRMCLTPPPPRLLLPVLIN